MVYLDFTNALADLDVALTADAELNGTLTMQGPATAVRNLTLAAVCGAGSESQSRVSVHSCMQRRVHSELGDQQAALHDFNRAAQITDSDLTLCASLSCLLQKFNS